jgi:hypothetical protein
LIGRQAFPDPLPIFANASAKEKMAPFGWKTKKDFATLSTA